MEPWEPKSNITKLYLDMADENVALRSAIVTLVHVLAYREKVTIPKMCHAFPLSQLDEIMELLRLK